jgi:hypothetical protein
MKAAMDAVIGVDSHERTHTLVADDALGRELGGQDRERDRGRPSRGDGVGRSMARPPLGTGGLPASHAHARGGAAACRRAGRARPDADGGRCPAQRPPARQVRRDRRAGRRPRCVMRARPAVGSTRRPVAAGGGCWSTIAMISSPSEPASRAGAGGSWDGRQHRRQGSDERLDLALELI